MSGSRPASTRVFAPPREHGAYGVWLASLLFSLIATRGFDQRLLLPALAASFVVLFTLDYMRVARLGGWGPLVIGVVSLLYLPLVVTRFPLSLAPVLLSLVLLYATMYSRQLTNIAGAALVGVAGSFIHLAGAGVDLGVLLFPPAYNLLATSQAQIRVTGPRRPALVSELVGAVLVLALGAYFLASHRTSLPLIVLAVDVVVRFAMRRAGVYDRMELKKYGLMEFARTLGVQVVVALLLKTGG